MIAIVKYNAGNIRSVQDALSRLGYESIITDDPQVLRNAEKVIFPGVGEASSAMENLRSKGLAALIPELKQPFLGICLGLQLMCNYSEEGETNCLGIFNTKVSKFVGSELIPQMGWNNLEKSMGEILRGITIEDDLYFIHSYYAELCSETTGICNYILPFSAVMEKKNFYATQFHPEKSGDIGERILQNFLEL